MTNTILIAGIALIAVSGIVALVMAKMILKKSFVFTIFSILILPFLTVAAVAFFIGVKGLIHVSWGAPVLICFALAGFWLVTKKLQKPMNEMMNTVHSLSKGDVDVVVGEKYQKGGNEIAQVKRMLVIDRKSTRLNSSH